MKNSGKNKKPANIFKKVDWSSVLVGMIADLIVGILLLIIDTVF